MNKEIEATYQGDPFFVELRDRWVAKLYRYSRETIVRFGQASTDPKSGLAHAHEDEEVEDVVTTVTLCIVLLASKFLATHKHEVEIQASGGFREGLREVELKVAVSIKDFALNSRLSLVRSLIRENRGHLARLGQCETAQTGKKV